MSPEQRARGTGRSPRRHLVSRRRPPRDAGRRAAVRWRRPAGRGGRDTRRRIPISSRPRIPTCPPGSTTCCAGRSRKLPEHRYASMALLAADLAALGVVPASDSRRTITSRCRPVSAGAPRCWSRPSRTTARSSNRCARRGAAARRADPGRRGRRRAAARRPGQPGHRRGDRVAVRRADGARRRRAARRASGAGAACARARASHGTVLERHGARPVRPARRVRSSRNA